jgi:hypothetical protein
MAAIIPEELRMMEAGALAIDARIRILGYNHFHS